VWGGCGEDLSQKASDAAFNLTATGQQPTPSGPVIMSVEWPEILNTFIDDQLLQGGVRVVKGDEEMAHVSEIADSSSHAHTGVLTPNQPISTPYSPGALTLH